MSDTKRAAEELRQEATKIDAQLLALIDRRAKISRKLGHLRGAGPAMLPLADRASTASLLAKATGDMPPDALREIFRVIHAGCLGLELAAPVVVVGPPGSAGHVAARKRFGVTTDLVSTDSAEEALQEVMRQRAGFAVLALETKSEGPVQATIAALTALDLKIVTTFELPSTLHLVSRSGDLAEVERVHATPHDHARCKRFLAQELPRALVVDVLSPELACRHAQEDPRSAALADESFAAQFDLVVTRRHASDASDDRTRYAIVGTRPSGRTGSDLSAVVFSVSDSPGALIEVLRQFAERGINLSKIHSRPTSGEAWSYLFFVEFAGHATDRPIVAALEDVKRSTPFFKLLGSYPAG